MWIARIAKLLDRFRRETAGKDLLEYALLAAAVGIGTVAAWDLMDDAILRAYSSWDTAVQSLWEPKAPTSPPPAP